MTPSPKKPSRQVQLNPPMVLMQRALMLQLCISSEHSSRSKHILRIILKIIKVTGAVHCVHTNYSLKNTRILDLLLLYTCYGVNIMLLYS